MKTEVLILGAGIGGLAAGASLKEKGIPFKIIERNSSVPYNLHNGVHYLHSIDLKLPFDFEFKKITATEEIWNPRTDSFKEVSNIPEMIDYSMKVMGLRHPSSIMDPGRRSWDIFLPQTYNMNDLLKAYYRYIEKDNFIFDSTVSKVDVRSKIVFIGDEEIKYEKLMTTVPMPDMIDFCSFKTDLKFDSISVHVTNYKTGNIVANWLIGIYISDDKFPPFRITILNNIISMESVKEMEPFEEHIVKYHLERYFDYDLDTREYYEWKTGRIFGLTEKQRINIVEKFVKYDIYPMGRFGLWDGKLLMDSTAKQANMIINNMEYSEFIIKELSGFKN